MKKLQYVLITLTVIFLGAMFGIMFNFAPELTYDLSENSEPEASKILYEYILQDKYMTDELIKDADITQDSVRAFEYDLNDDGENEIIGVVYSTLYYGAISGYDLLILQKQENGKYENISWVASEPHYGGTRILKYKKHNDYKRLFLTKKCVCGYNSEIGKYQYLYNIDIIGLIRHYIWLYRIDHKY